MDGWVDGWMGGLTDGWVDGRSIIIELLHDVMTYLSGFDFNRPAMLVWMPIELMATDRSGCAASTFR